MMNVKMRGNKLEVSFLLVDIGSFIMGVGGLNK
jgi:hypothetical protein